MCDSWDFVLCDRCRWREVEHVPEDFDGFEPLLCASCVESIERLRRGTARPLSRRDIE